MAQITLSRVNPSQSKTIINTDVSDILIEEAFLGVRFKTAEGEQLAVAMRDGGFEVYYSGEYNSGFNQKRITLKNGEINRGEVDRHGI